MPTTTAAWGLLLLGCAAPLSPEPEPTTDEPSILLRCEPGEGPLLAPKEWPRLGETIQDRSTAESRARVDATWERAQSLSRQGRFAESCDAYIDEWREAQDLGYRARVMPYSVSGDNGCARGWSEFLPYQVPELCGYPSEAMRADVTATNGLMWKYRYLTGVAWFRLGGYQRAMECFALPRAHSWVNAASECFQLAESYHDRQSASSQRPPAHVAD